MSRDIEVEITEMKYESGNTYWEYEVYLEAPHYDCADRPHLTTSDLKFSSWKKALEGAKEFVDRIRNAETLTVNLLARNKQLDKVGKIKIDHFDSHFGED